MRILIRNFHKMVHHAIKHFFFFLFFWGRYFDIAVNRMVNTWGKPQKNCLSVKKWVRWFVNWIGNLLFHYQLIHLFLTIHVWLTAMKFSIRVISILKNNFQKITWKKKWIIASPTLCANSLMYFQFNLFSSCIVFGLYVLKQKLKWLTL